MLRIICFVGVCLVAIMLVCPAYAELVTLEQALAEAYQNNPSLEAERAKLRATDEQVALALGHWRPTIEATSSVGKTYQRSLGKYGTGNFADNTTSYGAQVIQPIFRGFRTLSETESAKKQVLAGRAQLQAAEQKLLLDAATAFLDVVRDEFLLNTDREHEVVLRKKLEETVVRAREGDLTQTDVQQAETRLARAEVARLQTENTLNSDREAYMRLIGHAPEKLAKPKPEANSYKSAEEVVRLAEVQNPSVVAALYMLDQADADISANKGSLLPELNLVGTTSRSLGQSATSPGRYDSSAVMLQLKIPLYEAGSDHAKIRAAQQTSVQRRMELEEARHRAREAAKNAWQALLTTSKAIDADKRGVEAATRALEGVRVQAHVGTRTTLDELNAEQELLDAKTDLAKAEHDRAIAILQIKSAVGGLTADALKLPLEPYDPKQHYEDTHALWVGFGGADKDVYAKPRDELKVVPVAEVKEEQKATTSEVPAQDSIAHPIE